MAGAIGRRNQEHGVPGNLHLDDFTFKIRHLGREAVSLKLQLGRQVHQAQGHDEDPRPAGQRGRQLHPRGEGIHQHDAKA